MQLRQWSIFISVPCVLEKKKYLLILRCGVQYMLISLSLFVLFIYFYYFFSACSIICYELCIEISAMIVDLTL